MLCVGLDPDIDKLPQKYSCKVSSILDFNKEIIDSTYDHCCGYKLNFAFFERYGVEGYEILKKTFEHIPSDRFTIADAKRGDIGNTSKAYASSVFEYFEADSITVSPYMGEDSVKPFLDFADKLTFILCLTSNNGARDFQKLTSNGKLIYEHVLSKSLSWGAKENLGFVTGATRPEELSNIRKKALDNVLLIPGIGAQGGDIKSTISANASGPALINSSRGIIYASSENDFANKSAIEAKKLNELINKIRNESEA